MLGIVAFIYLQELTATNNNQCLIDRQSQHFIHSQKLSLSDTAGFPVLRCVIGNTPGAQHLRFAQDMNGYLAGAFADVFGCQLVNASEEKLHITVAENFLPLV